MISLAYHLDDTNRITAIEGKWNAFAEANDGANALSEQVLGQLMLDYVAGDEMKEYLDSIFQWSRKVHVIFEMNYRCDSPSIKRIFKMMVVPIKNHQIQISHTLLHSQSAEAVKASVPKLEAEMMCSICCSVRVSGIWSDPFEKPGPAYTPAQFDLCPKCRGQAQDSVKAAKRNQNLIKVGSQLLNHRRFME